MDYRSRIIDGVKNKYILRYGRVCDLTYLVFSDKTCSKDEDKIISLHVQCGFRIIQRNRVVVCNEEMYIPRGGASQEEVDNFKWDEPHARYDECMKCFMESALRKVMDVTVYECGDIVLKCDDGTKICIYITSTDDNNEQWRYIQENERHIIRTPYTYELADEYPDNIDLNF